MSIIDKFMQRVGSGFAELPRFFYAGEKAVTYHRYHSSRQRCAGLIGCFASLAVFVSGWKFIELQNRYFYAAAQL